MRSGAMEEKGKGRINGIHIYDSASNMYERHRGDDRVVNEVTEWSKQMNIENIAIKDIKPYERNAAT